MSYSEKEIKATVDAQRAFFRTGATLDVKWRIDRLKELRDAVLANEEAFGQARPCESRPQSHAGGPRTGGETGNWCVVRKDADIKDAARTSTEAAASMRCASTSWSREYRSGGQGIPGWEPTTENGASGNSPTHAQS